MNEVTGWDKLTEQLCNHVREEVEATRGDATGDTETERLLHHAILMAPIFRQTQHTSVREVESPEALEQGGFTLFYQRQAPIRWRVDFLFHCWDHGYGGKRREWKRLIVECEDREIQAHDELRAARIRSQDKWAAETGHTVLRFTGRDVAHGPLGCALQIYDWAAECWP